MAMDTSAPLSDDELDDILLAFESFGSVAAQAIKSDIPAPSAIEQRDGCIVLRPEFGKPHRSRL